jgi:hypothetical protein
MIEDLTKNAQQLLEALERGDPEAAKAAQEQFSRSIEEAWSRYESGEIEVAVEGLPRVMYQWTVEELPEQVEVRSSWDEALKELKRFQRTMDLVVEPREAK